MFFTIDLTKKTVTTKVFIMYNFLILTPTCSFICHLFSQTREIYFRVKVWKKFNWGTVFLTNKDVAKMGKNGKIVKIEVHFHDLSKRSSGQLPYVLNHGLIVISTLPTVYSEKLGI